MSDVLEVTRRALLVQLGAGAAVLSAQQVEHVHQAVAADKSAANHYTPKSLTAHEYATLQHLAEIIVPGARASGAADFIDFLCAASDEMKAIYTGGLLWLDGAMRRRYNGETFLAAKPEQQTALLDVIAFRENINQELAPGVRFFAWARRMVVDAYYTSPAGIKEVGYLGNGAMTHFTVPQECIDYAIKRSPFA